MLELKNVSKTYKSKEADDTLALNDVSCKFANKGLTFVVGASGSGKSTLLNCLGGLDAIDYGEIIVNGQDISKLKEKELDTYRNSYIGFVFQDFNILEEYNVFENVNLALELQGGNEPNKVLNILEQLSLKDLEKRNINELSGGQKQRVAIARALVKDPYLILADEPTGNLDIKTSKQICEILKSISEERAVIIVSHDLSLAKQYGDRIIEISDGKIVKDSNNRVLSEAITKLDLKKSILSSKNALKLTYGNIKAKKGRFIVTIILLSFALLFVAFTLNMYIFNKTSLSVNTMVKNNEYYVNINRSKCIMNNSFPLCNTTELTDEDIKNIEQDINVKLNKVYYLYNNDSFLNFTFGEYKLDGYGYYDGYSPMFVEITDESILENIIGKIPKNKYEIVLTKRGAEKIVRHGVLASDGKLYKPSSLDNLINDNKEIMLGKNKVKVVGYTNDDDSIYESVKETGKIDSQELWNHFGETETDYIYVRDFVDSVILENDKNFMFNNLEFFSNNQYLNGYKSIIDKSVEYFNEDGLVNTNSLDFDQIILSLDDFKSIYGKDFDAEFLEFQRKNVDLNYKEAIKQYFIELFASNNHILNSVIKVKKHKGQDFEDIELRIAGVTLDDNTYLSTSLEEYYSNLDKSLVSTRIYSNDKIVLRKIFDNYRLTIDETKVGEFYTVDFKYATDCNSIAYIYKFIHVYVVIITCVFILFASVLIYNFIIVTINYSKKNIGILRAMGASNDNIIKIFGYESLIIGCISWGISIISWIVVTDLLNKSFGSNFYIIEVIVKEPIIILYIFLFIILLSLVLTFMAISRISKIKPIDTILNKK